MSEDNYPDNPIVLFPAPKTTQPEPQTLAKPGKVIPFPTFDGSQDLVDGIRNYHTLFECGFDFLYYNLLEKYKTAFQAFPAHTDTFLKKEVPEQPHGIYFAALLGFEKLVRKLTTESLEATQEGTTPPREGTTPPIHALHLLHRAKVIQAYQRGFQQVYNQLTSKPEVYLIFNQELRLFGQQVLDSSIYLQTVMKSLEGVISVYIPLGNPTPTDRSTLEQYVLPFSDDDSTTSHEIEESATTRTSWIRYASSWVWKLQEKKDQAFKAWDHVIWQGVRRVYTPGGCDLELNARMNYRSECEKEQRFMLGFEYYQRILERLNPQAAPLLP